MAMTARTQGVRRLLVPTANAREAAVVTDLQVFGVGSLSEAVGILSGQIDAEPVAVRLDDLMQQLGIYDVDFSDVRGQEYAKRALVVAASGGHNVITVWTVLHIPVSSYPIDADDRRRQDVSRQGVRHLGSDTVPWSVCAAMTAALTILLLLQPSDAGGAGTACVRVHDLAALDEVSAQRLEGMRALCRVRLDSTEGEHDGFILFDCKSPDAVYRSVRLYPFQHIGEDEETQVVEPTLLIVRHRAAGQFPAMTEYRLTRAVRCREWRRGEVGSDDVMTSSAQREGSTSPRRHEAAGEHQHHDQTPRGQ
jgi:hypothetical protein